MKIFSPPLESAIVKVVSLLGLSFHHSSLAVSRFAVNRRRGSSRRRSPKRAGGGRRRWGDPREWVRAARDGEGLLGRAGDGTSDVS